MTRISIHQARAGMQLAHPVRDPNGRTLLEKGAELDDNLIARLKKFNVTHLEIEGAVAAGDLTAGLVRDMLVELSQEYPTRTAFGCALELRMHGLPALREVYAGVDVPDAMARAAGLRLLGHVAHVFTDAVLSNFLPEIDVSDDAADVAVAGAALPGLDVHDPALRDAVLGFALPALCADMAHDDERVRLAAARALERVAAPHEAWLAEERRQCLRRGMEDPHADVVLACALGLEADEAFVASGGAALGQAYLHVARTSRSPRRYQAMLGLGRLDLPGAREALMEAVDDPTISVRRSALYAIGDLREARALERVIPLVADEDDGTRAWACRALGRFGDALAVPALVRALHDPQEHVERQAFDGLLALGDKAEPALVGALSDHDWYVRFDVCNLLAEGGSLRALPALKIRAGTDEHRFVREAAVKAAERILQRQKSPPS